MGTAQNKICFPGLQKYSGLVKYWLAIHVTWQLKGLGQSNYSSTHVTSKDQSERCGSEYQNNLTGGCVSDSIKHMIGVISSPRIWLVHDSWSRLKLWSNSTQLAKNASRELGMVSSTPTRRHFLVSRQFRVTTRFLTPKNVRQAFAAGAGSLGTFWGVEERSRHQ